MKKIALVLSGGGAKGAFQAGALQFIEEKVKPQYPDFKFDIISGVSVGCLNGVMLAMNKYSDLIRLWNEVSNKVVYRGKVKLLPAAWRVARGKNSVLENDPLKKLISQYVSLSSIVPSITFRMGMVSLVDGKYHYLSPSDFKDNTNFLKAVLASTVMPIFWEPVDVIQTNSTKLLEVVDGGLRNNSPLGDVIDLDPDEIVVINCSAFNISNTVIDPDPLAAKNIFSIAKRSLLDIALNEIFITDLREFLDLNHLVRQATGANLELKSRKGRILKAFKSVIISPSRDLGDVLDFSKHAVQKRIKLGYEAAQQAFDTYQYQSKEPKIIANIPV